MASSLEALLAPIKREVFLSEFYEECPLHVDGGSHGLSLAQFELEALVRGAAETQPRRLRANLSGEALLPPRSVNPRVLYEWSREVYNQGATLVVNYVESLDPRLRRFVDELAPELGARITLTLFMTPPNAQGFSPHFDTLDVFVIQMQGTKRWCLGSSAVRLPTLRQGRLISPTDAAVNARKQVAMCPGNVLYIPRGVVHWAETEGQASAHLTADIDSATVGDMLLTAVQNVGVDFAVGGANSDRLVHAQEPDLGRAVLMLRQDERPIELWKTTCLKKWDRLR